MWFEELLKRGLIPEAILRWGIRRKLTQRMQKDPSGQARDQYTSKMLELFAQSAIAIHTDDANEQHYELPSSFFTTVLGPRLKYSSCFYESFTESLEEAEELMLKQTVEYARVEDGQSILDLGCGWGSLTLYLAEHFPTTKITALSNSSTQKAFIDKRAQELGYQNITVLTGNIAEFEFSEQVKFDRILSVEMFEHMRNYYALFVKLNKWLKPQGTLFVHMFARHGPPYLFEEHDDQNFMAKYFFTGGTMLNVDNLPSMAPESFTLKEQIEINGLHYTQTLEAWLVQMKRNKQALLPILKDTYGESFKQWWEYWKIFFIVCAELFAYNDGNEWVVMHYLFTKNE